MTVRRLRADEAALFKTLRALAAAPDAFAHTHAEISAKPEAYWQEMTPSVTEPGRHAMFVAELDDTPIGMAFGLMDREHRPHQEPRDTRDGAITVSPIVRGV
jgi:Acetyltransferase (GNAT) domain